MHGESIGIEFRYSATELSEAPMEQHEINAGEMAYRLAALLMAALFIVDLIH
jgi:hypothetical protein